MTTTRPGLTCKHCSKAIGTGGHWQVVTAEAVRNYHERRGCTAAAQRDAKQTGVSLWHTMRNDISKMFSLQG